MRITFDPKRLKARRLTVDDIKRFIDRKNLNQSGGYFIEGDREWTVRTVGELLNTEAFRGVMISKPGEPIMYLSDVAEIEDKFERPDWYCRINGVPGIVFNVSTRRGPIWWRPSILSIVNWGCSGRNTARSEFGLRRFTIRAVIFVTRSG